MAWKCSSASNEGLIRNLQEAGIVKDQKVANAMIAVDRGQYTPRGNPYVDSPQGIGYNATISAPHMHAQCLELLKDHLLRPNSKALDVGSGSGYLVACMGTMLFQNNIKGIIVGIEHIPELVQQSIANCKRDCPELLSNGIIHIQEGDGFIGLKEQAPYDCIHVGAASPYIPKALLQQLKPEGRMVIPVGPDGGSQHLMMVDKAKDGTITEQRLEGVRYVPLCSKEYQLNKT